MRVDPARLAPYFQTFFRKVTLGLGSPTLIVNAFPNRVGIQFSSNSNAPYWIWTDASVASNVGILLPQNSPALQMTYNDFGPIVGSAWYGWNGTGIVVYMTETWFGDNFALESPANG